MLGILGEKLVYHMQHADKQLPCAECRRISQWRCVCVMIFYARCSAVEDEGGGS